MRWLALLLLFSLPAMADSVTVAFSVGRPPFIYVENGQPKGIEWEVVRAAFARQHLEVQPVYMSNRRLLAPGTLELVDAATQASGTDDGGFFYSQPYVAFENYAISRKSANLKIEEIKDLRHHDFAVWQHGWSDLGPEFLTAYGPDLNGNMRPEYHEFVDQKSQVRYFWQGHAQVLVIDKSIFLWLKQRMASELDTSAEVTFHNIFKYQARYQLRFRSRSLRDKFDAGLKELRDSGDYDRIAASYGVSHP